MNSKIVKKYYLIDPKKYAEMMKPRVKDSHLHEGDQTTTPPNYSSPQDVFLHPSVKRVKQLDQDMKGIMSDDFMSDFEKLEVYNQKLGHYLKNFKSALTIPTKKMLMQGKEVIDQIPSPKDNEMAVSMADNNFQTNTHENITSSIPKSYRSKANKILNHLKKRGNRLSWVNDGTVYYQGKTIPNSNIQTLISDAVRQRKDKKSGSAWDAFSKALKNEGVPMYLFNSDSGEANTLHQNHSERNSSPKKTQKKLRKRKRNTPPKNTPQAIQWDEIN